MAREFDRVAAGKKAAATLKAKDPLFYQKLGALGGKVGGSKPGLFAHGLVDPHIAGYLGGKAKLGKVYGPRNPKTDTPINQYNRIKQRESRARRRQPQVA